MLALASDVTARSARGTSVTTPRPGHSLPWLLSSLVVVACVELLYAANAAPDRALTETAWRAGPFQVLVWISARLSSRSRVA